MLYFDTSFLAPLVMNEATSAAVENFFLSPPSSELAISHWTRVEFSSLLAEAVRMNILTPEEAARADGRFETLVRESMAIILPSVVDYDLARTFLAVQGTGLRGGDALHLAIAKGHAAEAIFTLDRTMLKAALILGVPARSLDQPARRPTTASTCSP